jgi:hypothetical protein
MIWRWLVAVVVGIAVAEAIVFLGDIDDLGAVFLIGMACGTIGSIAGMFWGLAAD